MQHTATHCTKPQHTTTDCNTLLHTAAHARVKSQAITPKLAQHGAAASGRERQAMDRADKSWAAPTHAAVSSADTDAPELIRTHTRSPLLQRRPVSVYIYINIIYIHVNMYTHGHRRSRTNLNPHSVASSPTSACVYTYAYKHCMYAYNYVHIWTQTL